MHPYDPAWEQFILRCYVIGDGIESLVEVVEGTTHRLILAGVLKHGDPLPSSDHLAEYLKCSKYAIHNAYTQLKERGVVSTSTRAGTWIVSARPSFRDQISRLLRIGRRVGISPAELESDMIAELKRLKASIPSGRKKK